MQSGLPRISEGRPRIQNFLRKHRKSGLEDYIRLRKRIMPEVLYISQESGDYDGESGDRRRRIITNNSRLG